MKKKYILKKNYDIEKILKKKKVANNEFIIYFNNSDEIKLCFSVPKKLGNAVMRNKKRRQMKAILRSEFARLPKKEYVIIFRKNGQGKKYKELNASLSSLIKKI